MPPTLPSENGKQPARSQNFVTNVNNAINGALERMFEALGRLVGRRPVVVIVASLIVAGALAMGRFRLEEETRGEKLWTPVDNESTRNNDFVKEHFPSLATAEVLYLEREDGGDVLTPEALDKALTIHNEILALQWKNTKDENNPSAAKKVPYLPKTMGLQDLCLNTQGGEGGDDVLDCSMTNPLEMFGYDSALWADRSALLATINDPLSWRTDLTGPGFILELVLGGLERGTNGDISGCKVLALSYSLAGNKTLYDAQEEDKAVYGWEEEFLDRMEELDDEDAGWHVHRAAGRSADDEFGGTVLADMLLLQVALIAIALFTFISISNWQDGCVGSRFLLTVGGLLNIGLAYFAAIGFAGYLGLLYSQLMTILPFIMLGVGVDGMFVLQGAMDATDPAESVEVRMGQTIRTGGLSVAAASVTNFGAFMIGSNTSLPALSAFSIYAALGLLFDLILQITLFAAIMAIDKKRQENRKLDVVLCVKSPADEAAGYFCGACGPPIGESYRVRGMKWLGKQYIKKPVKAVVIFVWLGLLASGIYGTSQMRVDADVNNFIPDGSYLKEFFDTSKDQFGETGLEVSLYWVNDAEVQAQMDASLELFRKNEFVVAGTVSSWWEELKGNGTAPLEDFYQRLTDFIATENGAQFLGDLAFVNNDPSEQLISARSTFQWRFIDDTQEQIDAFQSMRDTVAEIPAPLGTSAFVHAEDFLNIEQYKTIGREVFMNIGLGLLMILIVVLFLVGNPVAAVLTFLCVASAILELVGFMYFQGTYIDSVSVLFLVISLGLAVDYSVHVAHGYLAMREPDPKLRMEKTMGQTGAAVVNGALSTLIAALCLSGSGSYVFITFFYALIFIVAFGAFQGLVVLPILLDIFRPAPHAVVIEDAVKTIGEESASSGVV